MIATGTTGHGAPLGDGRKIARGARPSSYPTCAELRSHFSPPLGTVVDGRGPNPLEVLAELTTAVYRWPWVVPCISLQPDQGAVEPLLTLVSELRGHLAVVTTGVSAVVDWSLILDAVRKRAPPNAGLLVDSVRCRVDDFDFLQGLTAQFSQAFGGPKALNSFSVSTYSRLFARFGPYTARDWRAVARLCFHCAVAGFREPRPFLPLRILNRYARKYLRISSRTLAEHVGWEWVIEGALRIGGYVPDSP
jgi:hypothetical protein